MRAVHGIVGDGDTSPAVAMKTEVLEPFIELGKSPPDNEHKTSRCPYCSKNLANTKEHIKAVHLKEKNYFCHRCEYKTLFKSDLLKHDELVHQKIKKSCPHCGKQVANLHEHIRLGRLLFLSELENSFIIFQYTRRRKSSSAIIVDIRVLSSQI